MSNSRTFVQVNSYNRRLIANRRLWIRHPNTGDWVKITLNPTKELVIETSGRTDEGYSYSVVGYTVDLNRRTIVREEMTEARDCDGKHRYENMHELKWSDIPNYHPDHGEEFWNPRNQGNALFDATPPRGWKRLRKNGRGETIFEDEE